MLLVLIFALITVSGLVAYLGDQIGMKIGKRRLSIFGIRPKYTSIIITIFTGILIATISISLLLLVSEGVRLAVFDMERLLEQLGSLNHQVKNMELKVLQTTAQVTDIQTEKDDIQNQKAQLQHELEKKQAEFHDLESKLDELSKTKMELERTKAILDSKIVKLEEQKGELENQKTALEDDVVGLENDVTMLTDQLEESTRRLDELTKKAASLALSSNMYAQEVEKLRYKNEVYRQQTVGYQSKDIVFRKGDITYMESLRTIPRATETEIVKTIDDLLLRANKAVEKYKLKRNEEDGRSILITEYDLYMLAKALTDPANEKLIIWMQAKKNILINNFLEANLTWEQDYRVYRRHEILAQKEIDANQDPVQVEKELKELLGELSQHSIEKGLLPNASGEVGGIGFVDFYQIVEGIRTSTGKVRVLVRATDDIWRPDSLSTENIEFEIGPVGG